MSGSKLLELISVIGAGIIGFGLGALFANHIAQYAFMIILIGILMHGLAMYKLNARNKNESSWAKFIYWLCWAILIGLAVYVLMNWR